MLETTTCQLSHNHSSLQKYFTLLRRHCRRRCRRRRHLRPYRACDDVLHKIGMNILRSYGHKFVRREDWTDRRFDAISGRGNRLGRDVRWWMGPELRWVQNGSERREIFAVLVDILGQDNIIRHIFLKKWAKPGLFLFIFRSFHTTNIAQKTIDDKSVDGVLGTQTLGGRMVGTDKSTELWRHPK